MNLPIHYRYNTVHLEDGITIVLTQYHPTHETKCLYYIVDEYDKKRRISKVSNKRYCYPTKKQALESFIHRQKSRARKANYSLSIANQCLTFLENTEVGDFQKLFVGTNELLNNFYFYDG